MSTVRGFLVNFKELRVLAGSINCHSNSLAYGRYLPALD